MRILIVGDRSENHNIAHEVIESCGDEAVFEGDPLNARASIAQVDVVIIDPYPISGCDFPYGSAVATIAKQLRKPFVFYPFGCPHPAFWSDPSWFDMFRKFMSGIFFPPDQASGWEFVLNNLRKKWKSGE